MAEQEVKISINTALKAAGVDASKKKLEELTQGARRTSEAGEQAASAISAVGGAVSIANPQLGGMIQMTAGLTGGLKGLAVALKAILANPVALAIAAIAAAFASWRAAVNSTREMLERMHESMKKCISNTIRDRNREIARSFKEVADGVEDASDKMRHLAELQSMRGGNARAIEDADAEIEKRRALSGAKTDDERSAIEDRYAEMKIERDAARRVEDIRAQADAAWNPTAAKGSRSTIAHLRAQLGAVDADIADTGRLFRLASGDAARKREDGDEEGADAANSEMEALTEKTKDLNEKRLEISQAIEKAEREQRQAIEKRNAILEGIAAVEAEAKERQDALNDAILRRTKAETEADRKAVEAAKAEIARLREEEAAHNAKRAAERRLAAERAKQAALAERITRQQEALAAGKAQTGDARAGVGAADAKLAQAWGWYRDKDSMRLQLDEEKAEATARRQFERDFDSLKRRKGRNWRDAKNLSVDDEAVRRVALAQEEKQAAERHLAEIERNTADLAAKLDELLTIKG